MCKYINIHCKYAKIQVLVQALFIDTFVRNDFIGPWIRQICCLYISTHLLFKFHRYRVMRISGRMLYSFDVFGNKMVHPIIFFYENSFNIFPWNILGVTNRESSFKMKTLEIMSFMVFMVSFIHLLINHIYFLRAAFSSSDFLQLSGQSLPSFDSAKA